MTDDPLISTTAIDTIVIDPSNHNTIYAGTGDLNFGSFSMGSQGILKSTDAGPPGRCSAKMFSAWHLLTNLPANFLSITLLGKFVWTLITVTRLLLAQKQGLYFSYDGGVNWTGPCSTNSFTTQRQDITGSS